MKHRDSLAAGTIVIVTALPEELAPLRRRARARRVEAAAGPLWLGVVARQAVVLACTGEGPIRAGSGLEAVLAAHAASAVIGVGVAGALTPDLRRGDVVVAREVRDRIASLDTLDGGWRSRAVAAGALPAVLLSVDRTVAGRRESMALAESLLAGGGVDLSGQPVAAAVDSESSSWARAARSRGIPCLLLRGICAAADDEPALLDGQPALDGGIAGWRRASRLLTEPRKWPAVVRSRFWRRRAAERAAELVEAILTAVPEKPKTAREILFADPASATSGHQ